MNRVRRKSLTVRSQVAWELRLFRGRLQGKRVTHFLHVEKTGGTAVQNALRQCRGLSTDRYVLRFRPHRVQLRDVPEGEGAFFFLRDPVSRFVSGFNGRKREGRPRPLAPWTPDEQIAFERYATPNQLALALSSEDQRERAHADAAMGSIGHVRRHYREWLCGEEYLRQRSADIIFIGFQEQLNDDFERLKTVLGAPSHLELPMDDVRAHRMPATQDAALEPAAIANLQHWYRDDYELLRVCKEIARRWA